MSIHKSKGLEFPVCFVCGLAKKFNLQDTSGKMIADMDMGICVDYVDVERRMQGKTVRKNIIGEKMRLDSLGEELRVLYVALTRAKEKLIMTGIADKLEKKLTMMESVTSCLDRGISPEQMLKELLGELELKILDETDTRFFCGCSKERVEKAIAGIGRKDLNEMIQEGKPVEIKCHFCNTAYTFSVEKLGQILEKQNAVLG